MAIHGWENRGAAVNAYRGNPSEFLRDLYQWQDNTEHPRYSHFYRTYCTDYDPVCPHCTEASGRWCPAHVRQFVLLRWREVVRPWTRTSRHLDLYDYGDIFARALKLYQRAPDELPVDLDIVDDVRKPSPPVSACH